ncbi:transposase [Streptomyces malaysiensis]
MGQHPEGRIFASLPRAGRVNATQMLAEWGELRDAYDTPDAVAAFASVAQVTKASGRMRIASYSWACNKRLHQSVTNFADNSRHESP